MVAKPYKEAMLHQKQIVRKRALLAAEILLVAALLSLAIAIFRQTIAGNRIRAEEQAATEAMQVISAAVPEEPAAAAEAPQTAPQIQPEISALMDENPDAVGLLHFEGDRTLYVCQTFDNSYYMSHRFDGSEDPAGMIYMDWRDSLWPRSDNLILYGHNMRDGSRFGTLRRFEQKSYLLEHPVFQLVELYETVDYVPFAIFHTTVIEDDPEYFAFDQTDFADDDAFRNYVAQVKARSVLDIPIDAIPGDRLLTLATCYSDLERGRLVIVCREVKAGENFKRN